MGTIYLIANVLNGKRYVGQTRKPLAVRWRNHLQSLDGSSTSRLHKAMRKYGVGFFTLTRLERCRMSELNKREAAWIVALDTMVPHGYNLTNGGGQLVRYSDELRREIGERQRGRKQSEESKRKRSEAMKGRNTGPRSQAIRDKIAAALKGRPPPAAAIEALRARRGQKRTEETKARMSEAALIVASKRRRGLLPPIKHKLPPPLTAEQEAKRLAAWRAPEVQAKIAKGQFKKKAEQTNAR